jgi:hypothetical protein
MPLTELAAVAAARAALDDRELRLIDQARRDGATWAQIAAALGLTSRQAAEQRRHRLATSVTRAELRRRADQDLRYGQRIAGLRVAVAGLHRAIGADVHWDRRFVRAPLVRDTVAAAAGADPGALFALTAQAVTDVAEAGAPALPPPVAAAVADTRRALAAAAPSTSH